MNITELYLTVYNILSKIALESFVLIKKCVFAIKKLILRRMTTNRISSIDSSDSGNNMDNIWSFDNLISNSRKKDEIILEKSFSFKNVVRN